MRISEMKRQALETLKGRWKEAIMLSLGYVAVMLVYLVLVWIFMRSPFVLVLLEVALIVSIAPLSYGLIANFIRFANGETVGFADLFTYGFGNFKKSWAIVWGQLYKMLPWWIAYIVLAGLAGGLAAALMIVTFAGTSGNVVAVAAMLTVVSIALLVIEIVVIVKSLLYGMTAFVMFDSNNTLTGVQAATRSGEMMKGHRGRYFLLDLSFIGWAILAGLTFGIGLLWLCPYVYVSTVVFYKDLKGNHSNG